MISQIREPLTKIAQPIIIFFARLGIHPTVFTVLGLLLSIAAGVFLALDNFLVAFVLLWIGGAMDFIDGGVARYLKVDSKKGSFLDSVIDRVSDIAVFVGIIWSEPVDGVTGTIMVASALMVSYVRAKGESMGIQRMAVGIMERGERWLGIIILIFISLLVPNQGFVNPIYYIAGEGISYFSIGYMVLTGLCVITVIQRFIYASIQLTKSEEIEEPQQS
ncbi:MAG: CDP-alcohol phosphatidyltransferase family protein [Candidatus Thorarchaeota archaeon]